MRCFFLPAHKGFPIINAAAAVAILLHVNHSVALSLDHRRAATETLATTPTSILSRRKAFVSSLVVGATTIASFYPQLAAGADANEDTLGNSDTAITLYNYRGRDRKMNAQAVIRDDYWYIFGKTPPQLLTTPLKGDDPQFNAFGSCQTSETTGTNSCTYVSLKQRIPAYSKYFLSIAYGAREFQQLGKLIASIVALDANNNDKWQEAETYVKQEVGSPPPGAVDAELKMVLFATGAFLISFVIIKAALVLWVCTLCCLCAIFKPFAISWFKLWNVHVCMPS